MKNKKLFCLLLIMMGFSFNLLHAQDLAYFGKERSPYTGATYQIFVSGGKMLVLKDNANQNPVNIDVYIQNWTKKNQDAVDGVDYLVLGADLKKSGSAISTKNYTFRTGDTDYETNGLYKDAYRICFKEPDAEVDDALGGATIKCKTHNGAHACENVTAARAAYWKKYKCLF